MRRRYWKGVLVWYFSAISFIAAGQQLHLQQVATSPTESQLLAMPGSCSVVHYLGSNRSEPTTVFRHLVLDSLLRVRHERALRLGGRRVEATGTSTNRQAAFYTFHWQNPGEDFTTDSTLTAVIDTAGRVLSVRRSSGTDDYRSAGLVPQLPSDSLFLQCRPVRGQRGFVLRCLDLQQRERWQLTLKSRSGKGHLLRCVADSAFVWVLADDNSRSRRVVHTAYCISLRTGQLVSATPLDYQAERRVATAVLPGPAHTLLLVGRSYQHRRINRKVSGNLFVTRLAPDGTRQLDHLNVLSAAPGLRPKIYWQALSQNAAGEVQLLGQAFTSTSWGENLAMVTATKLLTFGILGISKTTLHSKEVVSLRLNPQGEITQTHLIPLPGRNSYTYFSYVPGQVMATLAHEAGALPIQGLFADGSQALVRSGRSLQLLDLRTQQLHLLHADVGDGTAWRVRPGSLLLYRTANHDGNHHLDVERLTYAQ